MDLAANCKDKLAYFRIKELKDVLAQLGLPKQGKKQDLVDRILAAVSDDPGLRPQGWAKRSVIGKEAAAKIIDDTFRKMQVHGAPDLASKGQNGSNSSVKPKEEVEDTYQVDVKIRCPCGSTLQNITMVQCEDPRCRVWQHLNCVVIPEKLMEGGQPEIPAQFYCEICRVNRADPFRVTLGHPLLPVKLIHSNVPIEGGKPMQSVEKTFTLSKADRDLLQKTEYDLQAWCILLNDKVPFRMQWPQEADLQVNGVPVRTTNRPGSQSLGINGRDDGPLITTCSREGINKISLSAHDARVFCVGVRIVRRRTVQQVVWVKSEPLTSTGQHFGLYFKYRFGHVASWPIQPCHAEVLNLIPKEEYGETLEEALARVCRCVGGGNAADNADSDSDLEVMADSITVNLRCPMSGSRMKVAGRFKPCAHMRCFDLETFVELNERSRKWQCPICLKNYSLEHVIIDPFFNRITSMMRGCGEDINEIDVRPDGSWRARNETEQGDLGQWHNPDGSLCVAGEAERKVDIDNFKQIKQEADSEEHTPLKLGIKRNSNGVWEVSKPEDMRQMSLGEKFESQRVVPMSSSSTGSNREGEDPGVNQDGGSHFDFSTNIGHELDSVPQNFSSTYGVPNRISPVLPPSLDQNVIVLSDSEEDNVHLVSPGTVYGTAATEANGVSFSVTPAGVSDSYVGDPGLGTSGNQGLELFHHSNDDFGLWQCPPSGFQLFGTDSVVHDSLVDIRHSGPQMNDDFGLCTDPGFGSVSQVPGSSGCMSNNEVNGGLVDNPLGYCGDDPSLQIFLPTQPVAGTSQLGLRDNSDVTTAGRAEDWISLRLGGSNNESAPSANGFNSRHRITSDERMDAVDTASLLLSMNEDRSDKSALGKQSSGSRFTNPRPPRSVRPRLYLSIDTDSD